MSSRSIGGCRRGLARDKSELRRARQDLHLRVRVELAAQVAKVTADGHVADLHSFRDLPVVEPGRQLPEDLALAAREQIEQLGVLIGAVEESREAPCRNQHL